MTNIYDIAIIGAGIAGVSLAAKLAHEYDISLLEGEAQAGYHSTGRSAAVLLHNYGNEVIRTLTKEALEGFKTIESDLARIAPNQTNDTPLLKPRGLLRIAMQDEENEFNSVLNEAHQVKLLSPSELKAMIPLIREDIMIGGFYEKEAKDIDVDALHSYYMKQFKQYGGELSLSFKVASLDYQDKYWVIKSKDGRKLQAKILVNATGAWADVLAKMAGVKPLNIKPKRRSMAVVPAPPNIDLEDFNQWPLFGSVTERWYAKPQSGKLLISPAEEDDMIACDAFPDDMVLAKGIARFQDYIDYEVTRLNHSWAGLRSFAPDRSPIIGFDPQHDGFFWLAGQGGYGVQTAPAIAMRASMQLKAHFEGQQEDMDNLNQKLSPNRFS